MIHIRIVIEKCPKKMRNYSKMIIGNIMTSWVKTVILVLNGEMN